MIQRKKEIKRIFITALFVVTICLSNVQILNNFIVFQDDKINNNLNDELLDENLQSSNRNIDDVFANSGVNQDVRIYTSNTSANLLNNEKFFEIPSLASRDMSLVYGNFNFTFQNNFTTDYVIEDYDALYANDFIAFDYDTDYSGITYNNGTRISGGWNSLIDNDNSTYINFDATNGLVNFTISANFTGTSYTSGVINGRVQFNRLKILGFITSLVFRLYANADLTVRIYDNSQSTWIDVISGLPINSSFGRQRIKEHIINENLNFIDLTDTCHIQFIFERSDQTQFFARINGFEMQSTYAFDIPITSQEYVALEFDLRGEESTVNGFYAWIRTLDLVEAATTELNISLYRADRTLVRIPSNLRDIDLEPNYNEMIDSVVVNGYNGDSLTHFNFDISNTEKLNVSNYFIVIKSNNLNEVYSLVTLPHYYFGDETTDHQLKTTLDDGNNWSNAEQVIPTTTSTYSSGQLDASSFKLNVTRGYMPSDFIVNDNQTLRIQDIPLENLEIDAFPYNESSYLTWGWGQWRHDFPTAIEDDPSNNFRVDLTWNKSITKGFKFNVESYSVNAYWIETALSTYTVSYNNDPEWLFTYDFDKNDPSFNYWEFLEFWYVFHDYFTAYNVTNPINEKILPQGEEQSIITEDPSKNKIIVQNDFITQSGFYTLNLTSHNFIYDMHSYINYKGILWESNGFMNGDNISLRADIQDHKNKAPKSDDLNVILFYPNGTEFIELNSSNGLIDDSILFYDFNNQTILDVTKDLTIFGEYHLGFFWFNGSAIGCKKLTLYIDVYDIELYNLEYYSILDANILDGEIKNKVFQNYTMLVASINDTTGFSMPNFYPINKTDLNEVFSYEVGGQDLEIMITSFLQSENIINPGETININITLQNLHEFISFEVMVEVKLVSFINEEWIIAEDTSNSVLLEFSGHPNDNKEFSLDLTIPNLDVGTHIWKGVNAPIRLGGAKTIVEIYIDDPTLVGVFESLDYSLVSNETSDNFEGYILGMRVAEEATSRSILYDFERDECIYFPDASKFLVNIIDQNYVSSYEQFEDEFSLNLNSKFMNITIDPINPIKGQPFNLSSILTTEFGEELSGKNISCQYFNDDDIWIDKGSDITDSSGYTNFFIDTQTIDFGEELLLRLNWVGDTINGITKNVSVNIISEQNNLSISINANDVAIYQGKTTSFNIRLENIGDSNLRITNITIEINKDQPYSIVEIDYITLSWLPAGESSLLIVEVSVKNVKRVIISISVTAYNILTNEIIIVSKEKTYSTFQISIFDYLVQYFMGIIVGLIALIWIITLIYARHTKKQIETPFEEKPAKKPRRGYVPVAELKKPTPVKKIVKKKEEPKEEEKTDLDSLLEERGLADKKKKSEK